MITEVQLEIEALQKRADQAERVAGVVVQNRAEAMDAIAALRRELLTLRRDLGLGPTASVPRGTPRHERKDESRLMGHGWTFGDVGPDASEEERAAWDKYVALVQLLTEPGLKGAPSKAGARAFLRYVEAMARHSVEGMARHSVGDHPRPDSDGAL